jgi:uridine kinase
MTGDRTTSIEAFVDRVAEARQAVPASRSLLVAVSGIDGSGKGFVTGCLAEGLTARGLGVAPIGIDPWLDLPTRRFDAGDPGGRFYRHAIRFTALFEQLVLPLRDRRRIELEADALEETASAFHRSVYRFDDVDVVLLEGIFLLRRDLRRHYDLSLWVACSFETALERAIDRAQEGLSPAGTVRAYETIYFPAQRIHAELDDPVAVADAILLNDARLGAGAEPPTPRPPGTPGDPPIRSASWSGRSA